MAFRKLGVELALDSRLYERGLKRAARQADRFNSTLEKGRRQFGAGGLIGGTAATLGITEAVKAASDLQEQMSKTTVVFDESSAEIEEWSKTTTQAFGISRRQALQTASSFGALFAPLRIVGQTAAEQSRRLTELGADLASFYNTDVQDALDAIRSGIVGESEPLRRYGVLLSETRVAQQAMADTGKKNATQLTAQEKALARIKLIFKDTSKAQGDFARTSGGLANQTRIAKANIDDLKVAIGVGLVPAVTKVITELNKFKDTAGSWYGAVHGFVKDVQQDFKDLGVAVLKPFQVFPSVVGKAARDATKAIKDSMIEIGGGDELIPDPKRTAPGRGILGLDETTVKRTIKQAAETARKAAKAAGKKEQRKTGPTAADRNTWFDAAISRQLDRLQDLSLRKQLARLKVIAQEVRARLAVTKDATRRLTLEDQLVSIYRQQRSIQREITDNIKAGNQALKDRADAIKSAVIERLQRRQTDILNRRALQDAREQLRIARQLGGPAGIREATRALQDVRFDILRARVEAAPATLAKGGRFALGGMVTININGTTDPEAVARQVVAVLQKRGRRTTTQTRGPSSGNATTVPAGAH